MERPLSTREKNTLLYEAIRDYRRGAKTHEALVRLARELYSEPGKTVRVYVLHQRLSRDSPIGVEVIDGAGLRDVKLSVGERKGGGR